MVSTLPLLLFLFAICAPDTSSAKEPNIAIEIDPARAGEQAMPMWLGYLLGRQAYRIKNKLPIPPSGEIVPSFEEEVTARSGAVQIYQELKAKEKNLKDPYWETLSQIQSKGYMSAYVWTYLKRPEWSANHPPAGLTEFQTWSRANLKNHKAQTVGRLSVEHAR